MYDFKSNQDEADFGRLYSFEDLPMDGRTPLGMAAARGDRVECERYLSFASFSIHGDYADNIHPFQAD